MVDNDSDIEFVEQSRGYKQMILEDYGDIIEGILDGMAVIWGIWMLGGGILMLILSMVKSNKLHIEVFEKVLSQPEYAGMGARYFGGLGILYLGIGFGILWFIYRMNKWKKMENNE